jgi:dienelactone hydrolase
VLKKHHIIYIPGLGDKRKGYEFIIGFWKIYGVIPHVYRMGWEDDKTNFKSKLEKLSMGIQALIKQGNIVSLVGGSAGGSVALNALIENTEINAVVNLCGRLKAGTNVYPSLEKASSKSPAFKTSVEMFEKKEPFINENLKEKVLTLSPLWDEMVPKSTALLSGALNKTLPSFEHTLTGFLGLTIFSPLIISFIKKKVKDKS